MAELKRSHWLAQTPIGCDLGAAALSHRDEENQLEISVSAALDLSGHIPALLFIHHGIQKHKIISIPLQEGHALLQALGSGGEHPQGTSGTKKHINGGSIVINDQDSPVCQYR